MSLRSFALATSVLVLAATSCDSAYRFEREELLFRYVPKDDSLLVLEVEHGISGDPGKATDALESGVKGRRLYPAEGGFVHLDLDKTDTAVDPGKGQEHADLLEFARSVQVVDARVFLDDQGRLSFLRLTRISKFRRMLELVNAQMNRDHAGEGANNPAKPFEPSYPIFDEATRDLFKAAWSSGHAWLRIEGEAFVLDAPMTESNAARCLDWLVHDAGRERTGDDPDWIGQMTSIELSKGHALLRYGEAPKQIVRFAFNEKHAPGDSAPIQAELKDRGVAVGDWSALSVAQARLGLPPPAPPK
jgi:hypothetical protein